MKATTMRLLLSNTRRTAASRWTCSCQSLGFHSTSLLACPPNFNPNPVERKPIEIGTASLLTRRKPKITTAEGLRQIGPARTRFAPSPTGYLHLGSLRTALFNYMIAKATGGQFILRIEDTDQTRTVPDAEERLFRDLEWAGIEWDEGPKVGGPYGPYKQSERINIYQERAEHLLKHGHAYRCFCTPENLNKLAELRRVRGLPPTYDRHCFHNVTKDQSAEKAANGEKYVIRFIVPDKQLLNYHDLVYGNMRQRNEVFGMKTPENIVDDPIILKSDGFPTYHLANVIDDSLMKITHVIRGSEWMSSTHTHIGLYNAFGMTPPQFAHVALLVNKEGQKLSKREGSMNVSELRDQGIFPETLTNYIALLGWSHMQKEDMMGLQQLVDNASFKFTRGNTAVSFEKLLFLQKRHAKRYATQPTPSPKPTHSLAHLATAPTVTILNAAVLANPANYTHYRAIPYGADRIAYVDKVVHLVAKSLQYTNPTDLTTHFPYFFTAPTSSDLKAALPPLMKPSHIPSSVLTQCTPATFLRILQYLFQVHRKDWHKAELEKWINTLIMQSAASTAPLEGVEAAESEKVLTKAWNSVVHKCIRWAIFGGKSGPDGAAVMELLGSTESLRRLQRACDILEEAVEGEGEDISEIAFVDGGLRTKRMTY